MGAPPSEEQMADMLSNPMMAQTMNEALNNPAFIDLMIQSNPMLANMPNARELLQSPAFRQMMTNPEAIRTAARMRQMFRRRGEGAFPAPGVTDNTPATGGTNAAQDPFALFGGGDLASLFGPGAANPFGASPFNLFGAPPATTSPQTGGATPTTPAQDQTNATSADSDAAAAPTTSQGQGAAAQPPFNPFAALFNPPAGGQPAGSPAAANPFGGPAMSPELLSQLMQTLTGSSAPAGPADNRPPEERYAEQLRQLNDMGFFDFDRNVAALRRSGGSVQGAIEHLLNGS